MEGDPDAITLFKSLGIGLEDLAIASLVYDRAVASGRCEARPAKDCKRDCRYWHEAARHSARDNVCNWWNSGHARTAPEWPSLTHDRPRGREKDRILAPVLDVIHVTYGRGVMW
jgi:hypothetical protein